MSVANGPEGEARLGAFLNGLQQLGWIEGRNVRIDQRGGAGDAERARKYAAELVALGPDVILASGDHSVVASQQASRTVPIVFTLISDPVGTGYVESLARPGGNMTGFTLFEYSTSAKYLELLKEIAPGVKRAAIVREDGAGFLQLRQSREFFFGAHQLALFRNNLRRILRQAEATFTPVPLKISDAIFVAKCFEPHLLHLFIGRRRVIKIERALAKRSKPDQRQTQTFEQQRRIVRRRDVWCAKVQRLRICGSGREARYCGSGRRLIPRKQRVENVIPPALVGLIAVSHDGLHHLDEWTTEAPRLDQDYPKRPSAVRIVGSLGTWSCTRSRRYKISVSLPRCCFGQVSRRSRSQRPSR
jgi:hypothetical protein